MLVGRAAQFVTAKDPKHAASVIWFSVTELGRAFQGIGAERLKCSTSVA